MEDQPRDDGHYGTDSRESEPDDYTPALPHALSTNRLISKRVAFGAEHRDICSTHANQ